MRKMRKTRFILLTSVLLLLGLGGAAERPNAIWGFAESNVESQLGFEEKLAAQLSPERVRQHLQFLTSRPHLAGSERNLELAEYLRDQWNEYGLEDVELIRYDVSTDDGFGKSETYPDGPWGPESRIQRGAITYDFFYPGDPLTPGYASLPGAKRIPLDDSPQIPKIASLPLSYRDARPILDNLRGPEASKAWQGGLPFTYHLGPGPATVHMNHRDAWVYGAVDPASGTAAQLELARALGGLARSGLRPKRTLVFASWDAEEFSLTGSTEWGEQWAHQLKKNTVTYLNVDVAVSGPELSVSAVPALNRAAMELEKVTSKED